MTRGVWLLVSVCIVLAVVVSVTALNPGKPEISSETLGTPQKSISPVMRGPAPGEESRPGSPEKTDSKSPPAPELESRQAETESGDPLWGVTIGPLPPGKYEYCFLRDGQSITDPLNPQNHKHQNMLRRAVSVFEYPLPADSPAVTVPPGEVTRNPIPASGDRSVQFMCRGAISRELLFVAGFRGGYWGTDEFEPLNEAARLNLERIRKDKNACRLTGVVKDTADRPLGGALVRVGDHGMTYENLRTVRADGGGRFAVDRLSTGNYMVYSRYPLHYLGELVSLFYPPKSIFPVFAGDAREKYVELVMKPGGGAKGRVTDGHGNPIVDAMITTGWTGDDADLGQEGVSAQLAWTDPRGYYEFPGLPPMNLAFTAQACGYCVARISPVRIETGRVTEGVDFVLSEGMDLPGRVISMSGTEEIPVSGATVTAQGFIPKPGNPAEKVGFSIDYPSTRTDDRGRFRFDHVAPGLKYWITARKGLRENAEGVTVTITEGVFPEPVTLVLPLEGGISGHVVAAGGEPIPGAVVNVSASYDEKGQRSACGPYAHPHLPEPATAGSDGRFEIQGLVREHEYDLTVSADGYAARQVGPFPADPSVDQEIVLTAGGTLAGRVVTSDGRMPVMDFNVWAMMREEVRGEGEAVTGVDGRFEIPGLPSGTYIVGGRFEDEFAPLVAEPVAATVADGKTANVTLEAFPAVGISGTVRDQDQEPLPSALVGFSTRKGPGAYLEVADSRLANGASTDADGRYQITGLLHGRLMGWAFKEGYRDENAPPDADQYYDPSRDDRARIIVAKPGERIENVDFILHKIEEPKDEESVFRGIVLDPDGVPAPEVRVATYFSDGMDNGCPWFMKGKSAITGADGRFEVVDRGKSIRGLAVIASEDKPFCGWHEGRPLEEEEVVIHLIPCGRIAGIVGDGRGNAIAGASVYLQWSEGCNKLWGDAPRNRSSRDDGFFEFGLLPPGNYRIYAERVGYERGGEGEKRLELVAGKIVDDVVLILRKPDDFRGRLVDQFGAPLGGWKVSEELAGSIQPARIVGRDGTFSYRFHTGEMLLRMTSEEWTHRGNASSVTGRTAFKTGTISYPDETPADHTEFVLRVGGKVKGRVVFAGTGEPVPGIDVWLDSDPAKPKTPKGFTDCALSNYYYRGVRLTGSDGTFEVSDVPVGDLVLSLSGESILHKRIAPVVVGESLVADLGTIEVEPGRTIVGRLLHAVSGEPVYGAEYRVEARGVRRSELPLFLSLREPDYEGRFKITRITPDLASVVFTAQRLGGIGPEGNQMLEGPEIFGRVRELDLSKPGEVDVGDVPLLLHRLRGQIVNGRSGRLMTGSDLSSLRIEASGGTDTWERNFYGHDMEFSEDGFFTVTGVRPDWETLEIGLSGFLPVTVQPVPSPDAAGVIHLGVIRLEPG